MVKVLWILQGLLLSIAGHQPTVYYSSPALQGKVLNPTTENHKTYTIRDDQGQPMTVVALRGKGGIGYWYRRVFTEVCLTGECRPVDVGLYWHFTGKYLGIEVYREPLTKTDHSDFSPMDYDRLERILQNEWSDLREYTAEELVEPSGPTKEGVDGVTGATRKAVSEAAVKDAVYTTHTIWHLIHVGEPEQLALLARSEMAQNPSLVHELLTSTNTDNRNFVLNGIIDGFLTPDPEIGKYVLQGLTAEDKAFRNLSFRALASLDLSTGALQEGLAIAYRQLEVGEKVRLLTAMDRTSTLHPSLQTVLAAEFATAAQPWLLIKILSLYRQTNIALTDEEMTRISKVKTDHPALKKALKDFFDNNH